MKYTGITIGPIYKTLISQEKTRSIWAASYMFSYIMRKIASRIDSEFILPYIGEYETNEIGIFNDRMIFEGEFDSNIIDEVLREFSNENKIDYDFLKEYIQIHYKTIDFKEGNIVDEVYKYLDSYELFYTTTNKNNKTLLEFFEKVNSSKMAKFARIKKFKSLPEITTTDLDIELDDEADLDKIEGIKKYHKYIAIVSIDGDNMGKVNKLLDNADIKEYQDLSKDLYNFINDSHKKIKEFGGMTILAGGDDLLFFAPVRNKDKTIFDLIKEIDEIYNQNMQRWNEKLNNTKTSLSFGINISFYKYPLIEAIEDSKNLLYKAKNTKNSISFKVTKHSGQTFEGVIYKENINLLKNIYKFLTLQTNQNIYSSIIYKIDIYKFVLDEIAKNEQKVNNFFRNYFNENYDEKFFNELSKIITQVYNSDIKDKNFFIYSILRFQKFIGDRK